MELPTLRPSTPPPRTGLLTPPSTGGTHKRALFVEPQECDASSKRHATAPNQEEEKLNDFFEDYTEDSSVHFEDDVSQLSPDSSLIASDKESLTMLSDLSATSNASSQSAQVKNDLTDQSVPYVAPFVAVRPFPFTKLPRAARDKVYEHLLVVPAIICVKQKHTAFHDDKKAFLYAERRELLPGIAYALTQAKVNDFKSRFSRFPNTNLNILRVSKNIFSEARAVMYSKNDFDIVKPTNELTPQPDFSVRLFPPGYQRIVTMLNIRIRTFYDLHWLLSGGYNIIRHYYRSLKTLTLILELDSATKGLGRHWARKEGEAWVTYIKRLHRKLAADLFDRPNSGLKTIPTCIDLRVLFSGETYIGISGGPTDITGNVVTGSMENERAKREELRNALVESWELFKRGGK